MMAEITNAPSTKDMVCTASSLVRIKVSSYCVLPIISILIKAKNTGKTSSITSAYLSFSLRLKMPYTSLSSLTFKEKNYNINKMLISIFNLLYAFIFGGPEAKVLYPLK